MQVTGTVGDWAYLEDSGQLCRVLERHAVWGNTVCQVWLPATGAVLRVRESRLRPLDGAGAGAAPHEITYAAAAARIADALERDSLVAPLEGTLIPLPHQIHALARAIAGDRVRFLLADEVGLGKTIEAGLIMKELKIRGLVRRTLVVAPTGLVTQWVQEMRTRFDEDFRLVIPGKFAARRRAIERVGLVQVRQHRLAQLEREQAEWEARLAAKEQAVPELTAVILLRVARAGERP